MEPVYGADRVRRLRIVIGVLAVLALASCVVGVSVLTDSAEDRTTYAVLVTVVSGLLLAGTVATWRALPRGDRTVARGTVACGALALPVAFLTSGSLLGFLFALVGLATLFLALATEQPEAEA